ncbi:hypothetical protein G6L37_01750 [Agrobacterium rubi]|nr:hypothetical protein [Agrobacterium rubi]NTF24118.1 hypothetical protein [Agrobacterium rubi]
MFEFAEKMDNGLIRVIDGFCSHLQTEVGIPFGWMLSIVSIGTALIAFAAAMLMFEGDDPGRFAFAALWLGCLAFITLFFRRTLWHHMRKWPGHLLIQHWTRMAMMMREDGRPMRYLALFGTALFVVSSTLQLLGGQTDFALGSLRFLAVSMTPIVIMMYAFCAIPATTNKS